MFEARAPARTREHTLWHLCASLAVGLLATYMYALPKLCAIGFLCKPQWWFAYPFTFNPFLARRPTRLVPYFIAYCLGPKKQLQKHSGMLPIKTNVLQGHYDCNGARGRRNIVLTPREQSPTARTSYASIPHEAFPHAR